MKKGNILDICMTIIKNSEFSDVGKKSSVEHWAKEFNFYELVQWIEGLNTEEYLWYAYSVNYEEVERKVYNKHPKLLKDRSFSIKRKQFEIIFSKELSEFKKEMNDQELCQLDFKLDTMVDEERRLKKKLIHEIAERAEGHVFNYVLPLWDGSILVWFYDNFYIIKKDEVSTLNGESWNKYYTQKERSGKWVKQKYESVHEYMRFSVLLVSDKNRSKAYIR
ncbi:hypothetical protein U8V72_20280 [Priestia filamentosa]|uniref:hypothetical protein n=1 Tax=Priestia filamentosa TaxID=1402861 RepID=UPI00397AA471